MANGARRRRDRNVTGIGQCSITAFLAQDIFGGEKLSYENNPKQSREVHFTKEEKRLRYKYLKEALSARNKP